MQQQLSVPIQSTVARDPLGRVLFVLAVLALVVSPTQLTLPRVPLSPADALIALAAVVWVVRWALVRDTHNLPPFANWLVIIAGLFSVISIATDTAPSPDAYISFAIEMAQQILYLLVAVTIFRATLNSPHRIRIAVIALLAATSLAVLLAVGQRISLERNYQPDAMKRAVYHHQTLRAYTVTETPIQVSSTFGSWNEKGFHASRTAYVGFLGLVLPFALALLVTERRRKGMLVWLSLLFIGAAVSALAGYVVPALLLGLVVTGAALGARVGRVAVLGIVAYLIICGVIGGHNRNEVFAQPFTWKISAIDAQNPNYQYEGVRHMKKMLGEQEAAVNLLRGTTYVRNPALFGVGVGMYQKNIQEGYGGLSAISNQRLESDAQSGYLLTVVSSGMLGLAALIALYGAYLRMAWRTVRALPGNPWAAAMLGAMIALILMTLVSNPLVRGTSIVIAMLFALIGNSATLAPVARIHQQEE